MRIFSRLLACFCLLFGAAIAMAEYPDRSIRLIVPWPAGGGSDATARIVAKALQSRLGQPVVVENKPGAAGNIGTQLVAKADADGYTLLYSSGPFSVNPSLFRTLPFDTERDFAPVGQIGSTPSVIVVHPDFAARTLQDFIGVSRSAVKPTVYVSPGNGSAQHLAMELLRKKAQLELTHIPYKGAAPALTDLLGGQVPAMISGLPEVLPYIRAGRIRALAVTSAARSSLIPDVPTLLELGLAESGTAGWSGIHVRAGTPQVVVTRLSRELQSVLRDPAINEVLRARGTDVHVTTPEQFGQFVGDQIVRWRGAVAISGAKVD
ncbi:tripartite tricarboxylate transporter substrate binding protein [Polaromonas sp.]|uniref:tripartite tricarboxylate transporter substrate binding protein n=1 Tax=Polaromonas sp. TaxID=1869339 RepID=UPI003562A536